MRWTPLESVGEKCAARNLKAWRKLVYVICQNNAYICTTLTALAAATKYFLRHEFKDHLNADDDNTAEVCKPFNEFMHLILRMATTAKVKVKINV